MLKKREYSKTLVFIFVLLLVALPCQFAFAVISTDEDLLKITDENLMKLDPVLKPIIFEYERSMQTGAPPLFASHLRNSDFINTIIKITDNPMAINSAGVKVRSIIGDIVTADVPIRYLSNLIQLPNIVYVQAAHQMKLSSPMLDVSVPEAKADQVWKSVPGYTGKGVIVGIVDSGIDWSHPDFMGADGKSRILYLWDQTMPLAPQHPAGYSYGVEWTKAQIDNGQCLEEDVDGHGTHVSSIITGDDRGRDQFTGMAPDANIIFVKSSLLYADIVDADKNGNVGKTSKVILVQQTDFSLLQNYPNPFNPETWIPYQLKDDSDVTIRIYDISGNMIRELNLGHKTAGIMNIE